MLRWGVLAVSLAGCVVTPAYAPDVETVAVTPKPGVQPPLARGETALIVRAVPALDPTMEFRGAACRADAPYFSAAFTAPARLLIPDYGSAAPTVTVTCRAGSASGTLAAAPTEAWSGGLGGWPAIGISVGTGSGGGTGVGFGWYGGGVGASTGSTVVRYPELRVPLS